MYLQKIEGSQVQSVVANGEGALGGEVYCVQIERGFGDGYIF